MLLLIAAGFALGIVGFQLLYLVLSLRLTAPRPARAPPAVPADLPKTSVVIPLHDCAQTIGPCLRALLAADLGLVSDIIVVNDRSTDGGDAIARSYAPAFRDRDVPMRVLTLPRGKAGKVAALLFAGTKARNDLQLLMDADIVVNPSAVTALVAFHHARGAEFSSGMIYPQAPAGRTDIATQIICNNRLYRQGILQAVKNLYGAANFPGGLQLVSFAAYRALLVHGFLEDLTATYRVLAENRRIEILDQILAYEIERASLKSTYLQRLRWTIGAIQHLRTQWRTAATRKNPLEWLLINSYHVMWELQHYVITLSGLIAVAGLGDPGWISLVFALPWLTYAAQILRSAWLGRGAVPNSALGLLAHCTVFPILITGALAGAVWKLLRNRAYYFYDATLYRRS